MLTVQVLQSVQGMQHLGLADARPAQPLQQVDLLNGEPRLLTLLEHPEYSSQRAPGDYFWIIYALRRGTRPDGHS